MNKTDMKYATLGQRVRAFLWDYLLISIYLVFLVGSTVLLLRVAPEAMKWPLAAPILAQFSGFLLVTLPVSLYYSIPEASARQATWGKRKIGLKVVNASGERLTFPQAILRTAIKFIP